MVWFGEGSDNVLNTQVLPDYILYRPVFHLVHGRGATMLQSWPVGGQIMFAFGVPVIVVWLSSFFE